ncbi:hypothetical protein GYH30_022794 [Glycine max]|uniref:Uncharacterized protein n=1 Tax=Glycine max TaxID=3847 RepID=A0A0R0IXH6_SOYBN|nr:hypothetical protein GYH30_022794 [Glycine max]
MDINLGYVTTSWAMSPEKGRCSQERMHARVRNLGFHLKPLIQLKRGREEAIKVINGRWLKAKILPYKHAIAAHDVTIEGCPSQISCG